MNGWNQATSLRLNFSRIEPHCCVTFAPHAGVSVCHRDALRRSDWCHFSMIPYDYATQKLGLPELASKLCPQLRVDWLAASYCQYTPIWQRLVASEAASGTVWCPQRWWEVRREAEERRLSVSALPQRSGSVSGCVWAGSFGMHWAWADGSHTYYILVERKVKD